MILKTYQNEPSSIRLFSFRLNSTRSWSIRKMTRL